MAVAKIIELNASSKKSVEDAVQTGLTKAAASVKNVQGAWIKEIKVVTDGDGGPPYLGELSDEGELTRVGGDRADHVHPAGPDRRAPGPRCRARRGSRPSGARRAG